LKALPSNNANIFKETQVTPGATESGLGTPAEAASPATTSTPRTPTFGRRRRRRRRRGLRSTGRSWSPEVMEMFRSTSG